MTCVIGCGSARTAEAREKSWHQLTAEMITHAQQAARDDPFFTRAMVLSPADGAPLPDSEESVQVVRHKSGGVEEVAGLGFMDGSCTRPMEKSLARASWACNMVDEEGPVLTIKGTVAAAWKHSLHRQESSWRGGSW